MERATTAAVKKGEKQKDEEAVELTHNTDGKTAKTTDNEIEIKIPDPDSKADEKGKKRKKDQEGAPDYKNHSGTSKEEEFDIQEYWKLFSPKKRGKQNTDKKTN